MQRIAAEVAAVPVKDFAATAAGQEPPQPTAPNFVVEWERPTLRMQDWGDGLRADDACLVRGPPPHGSPMD